MSKLRTYNKEFKVASVSSNTNSFGLRGVILVAKDGEAWQVGINHMENIAKGDVWELTFREKSEGVLDKYPQFPFSCEIPERLKDAPAGVLKDIFG